MIDHELDHEDQAAERLAQQFRATDVETLVRIHGARAQGIEDVAFAMIQGRSLFGATGKTLDLWGDVVGQKRPLGMLDEPYRALLLGRIVVNTSHGRTEDLLDLVRMLGADDAHPFEMRPATVVMQYQGTLVSDDTSTKTMATQATPPIVIAIDQLTSTPFGFSEDPDAYGFGVGELARRL